MQNLKEIKTPEYIKKVLNSPIDSPTIRELAGDKNPAVIIVEDIYP